MSNIKKLMMSAAGGEALNVEDVFSTYLYDGNDSTQTITNGIDLSGEGGLVWIKSRSSEDNHALQDTERGADYWLLSNSTLVQQNNEINFAFNSDGFSQNNTFGITNNSDYSYASWTFRKAPKFFDVVTYTGTGSAQSISHDLGTTVGTLIVKRTDDADSWRVYHREMDATAPQNYYMNLDGTDASAAASTVWNNTAPTDTTFTVGTSGSVNASGGTYVAYLFAHNDGEGGDIIKCGSFTTPASAADTFVDLGFEPQWLLVKNTGITGSWRIIDVMRGMPTGSGTTALYAEQSYSESTIGSSVNLFNANPTGFTLTSTGHPYFGNSQDVIYIAIRRGTKVPESGDEVFDVNYNGASPGTSYSVDFPIDFNLSKSIYSSSSSFRATDRMRGFSDLNSSSSTRNLLLNSTAAEVEYYPVIYKVWNNTFSIGETYGGSAARYYSWKRAPNFFDVVAYTGSGAGTTFNHNLGVAPEMIWVKNRSRANTNWNVYHKDLELNGVPNTAMDCTLFLNLTSGISGITDFWGSSGPSDTQVTLGTNSLQNSFSGDTFVAYLFASLAGISKVGSYTGNGTSQTINCGFSSGARFILIKRADSTGDWYVWDTARGIVTGNDPHLSLNTTAAEVTTDDSIDPDSSGFIVNQVAATNINVSSAEYIFYAVA